MKEQDELLLPALSRRGFLKMSAAAMLAAAVPGQALAAMSIETERKLSFYHLHTSEKLSARVRAAFRPMMTSACRRFWLGRRWA